MFRIGPSLALALAAFAVFPAPRLEVPRRDSDAVAFALAFQAGRADEYRNKSITGVGTSFHGAITERLADGSMRTSLVITLGAVNPDQKVTPLDTWNEFVAAERARTTLVVALSGPNLPTPPTNDPTVYEFSGVYDGQVRTVARAPADQNSSNAGQSSSGARRDVSRDTGPCPGEKPRGEQGGSFYCAPLLTGATATIRR